MSYDNSAKDDLSYQCAAFAKFIYYSQKGKYYDKNKIIKKNLTNISATIAESTLKGLSKGTYLCVTTNTGAPHSMAIDSSSQYGITLYHANGDGTCRVEYKYYTWSQYASTFPGLTHYLD